MKPSIKKEDVKSLFDSKFIKIFDLQYEEGKHYYDASRRPLNQLVAIKSKDEFQAMLPDAVTCAIILNVKDEEPKLLLSKEYRYPTGRFLLSPPAGLLDPEDINTENPILTAAKREIKEETGLTIKEKDSLFIVNPVLFSSPGLTDESNALVCAVVQLENVSELSQDSAVGSECFDGFELISKREAMDILKTGTDKSGIYYSIQTYCCLMYFVSGLWR